MAMLPEGRRISAASSLKILLRRRRTAGDTPVQVRHEESIERLSKLFPRLKERVWQKGGINSGEQQNACGAGKGPDERDPELITMMSELSWTDWAFSSGGI